jgi:carbonic anhydrase/acetyltransferase-like protein (isoleucine patch superfamily)
MQQALGDRAPQVDPTAWIAPGAVVVGDVTLGAESSVWYAAVIRADGDPIRIGPRTNVQDGAVLHSDPGIGIDLGAGVSVGHRAVLHGCVVEDDVLVGMGAIVMNRARIGAGSVIAAGALVPEGRQVPPGSLVLGGEPRREGADARAVGEVERVAAAAAGGDHHRGAPVAQDAGGLAADRARCGARDEDGAARQVDRDGGRRADDLAVQPGHAAAG